MSNRSFEVFSAHIDEDLQKAYAALRDLMSELKHGSVDDHEAVLRAFAETTSALQGIENTLADIAACGCEGTVGSAYEGLGQGTDG